MMLRRLLPLVALASALAAAPAQAAACCLSANAFGIGRLAMWETLAVILGGSVSPVAGRWDQQATWRPNPAEFAETEWRTQLSALAAVHPRLQLSGRVPLVLTQKVFAEQQESGGGLGDTQFAVRYEPVFQGEYEFLPEVALNAGVTVPVGRTATDSQTALGSDVTSRGAWVPSASASVELARSNWFALLGGGVTWPLPMAGFEPGRTQQLGLGWQLTAAGGVEVKKALVLSLAARGAFEGPIQMDGAVVPESEAFEMGLGPAVAWTFVPHFTLQGGVDLELHASGLGDNRQGRTTASLALRYAYF